MSNTVTITIPIKKCYSCPYMKTERTLGAGYALDWLCSKTNNKRIAGYVEWDSDAGGVPEWCPYRKSEESALQKIRGYIQRKMDLSIKEIKELKKSGRSSEAVIMAETTRITCSTILDVIEDIIKVQNED